MTKTIFRAIAALGALFAVLSEDVASAGSDTRPNILFAISDDQSWRHAGVYGDKVVNTPNFDRIAKTGVRFTHAFAATASCTSSRAAILTGQHIWRLKEAANLMGPLRAEFAVYPNLLEQAGYHVGYARKGYGPVGPGRRKRKLSAALTAELTATKDPRVSGGGDAFDHRASYYPARYQYDLRKSKGSKEEKTRGVRTH